MTQIQSFSLHLQAFNTEYSTCDSQFSPESNKDSVLTAITTGHREEPRSDHPQTVIQHEIFSICRVCKDPKNILLPCGGFAEVAMISVQRPEMAVVVPAG